ncbi:MAG: tRNA-guanine transglycosylase, partial [Nitrosopumilus sp.]|nr:tRNA-guanine transglycosylase [Nitrosopumilus sp.]
MTGAGRGVFEARETDLAGRTGRIETNHGAVETPAYVPVVHPVRQSVPARELREMGFGMVITNAYITWKRAREEASRRGIHDLIGFDGAVMTDSGGYQVLEYGDVDVGPDEMAAFEAKIGSDIAVPLDRPTGLGITRAEAARRVRYTLRISREALAGAAGGQIWAGPVQGGRYTDLVTKSARGLSRAGFAMMALGSPVEYMESYDYLSLARMIAAARSSIPWSAPLHLFGAGHPLTI